MPDRKKVLFYRDFKQFQGGHLTFWNYYNHVKSSPQHTPRIFFSEGSRWDETNPWLAERGQILRSWRIDDTDVLMLGAANWEMLSEDQRKDPPVPIVNLILSIRHADPAGPYYGFLRHKAVRICCTEEVAEALRRTRRVNGPLFVNPHGLDPDLSLKPLRDDEKDIDVLIVGIKKQGLAVKLKNRITPHVRNVEALTIPLTRPLFLEKLKRAKIAVLLPLEMEGSYRPSIEAMALRTLVICPLHEGNRSFYRPGWNCFRPDYTEKAILDALRSALELSDPKKAELLANARRTVLDRSLEDERRGFLDILNSLDSLW